MSVQSFQNWNVSITICLIVSLLYSTIQVIHVHIRIHVHALASTLKGCGELWHCQRCMKVCLVTFKKTRFMEVCLVTFTETLCTPKLIITNDTIGYTRSHVWERTEQVFNSINPDVAVTTKLESCGVWPWIKEQTLLLKSWKYIHPQRNPEGLWLHHTNKSR